MTNLDKVSGLQRRLEELDGAVWDCPYYRHWTLVAKSGRVLATVRGTHPEPYCTYEGQDYATERQAKAAAIAALREYERAAVPAEVVAWVYEDTLPKEYPYNDMFQFSAVRDGVRMFPVFAPQAAAVPMTTEGEK